ncbi:MAG: nucleoside hydrolase [Rhizobiaceae bacterium]|nr:nucleoside hydrolase [Rhizobiaceae bacterium]
MDRIIIDCDPGHDDAIALFMAMAAAEAFDIAGITTVAGNIDVVQATRNARRICAIARRQDIQIHAGCSRPIVKRLADASGYHGETGLDGLGPDTAEAVPAADNRAADFIIETVTGASGPVTLVCLAPLTNLALALIKAPHIAELIGEVVFMGGARRAGGNVTPCATFNLACDPHAGHIVADSGVNLTMVSLDATSQVVVGSEDIARISRLDGEVAAASARMLDYFNRRRMERYGLREDQCSLNDACVVAYLLDRTLFSGQSANVSIEMASGLTQGMSVVDLSGVTGRPRNALWIDQADSDGVRALLHRMLGRFGRQAHDR